MAKKKARATADETPSIEESMNELQEIVQSLEGGQDPLDVSLKKFERGMKLLRTCHQQLEAAASRIEILTSVGSDGEVRTESFDGRATVVEADLPDDEESTLF